jgi:putative ABC transport system permease protein
VVGIVSDRSGLPSTAQVWLPLAQMPGLASERRDVRPLHVFGRLRDGVAPPAARAEVEGIAERLQRDHPDTNARIRARAVPINEQFLGRLSDPAWRAFIAVGFLVLAISCANVANLFLDRSVERAREVAIRTALGATRPRIVRQLLIEASVLAGASAVVGCGVAVAGVRLFRGLIPDNVLPYWFDYSMDWRVLAMLLGVSMATVLVFGVVPAMSGSKTNVNRELKDNRAIGSRGNRRWTTVFLTAEFALAVVMLANLALSLRLARSTLPSDAAIDTPEVLTAAITLTGARYGTAEQRAEFLMDLEQRLNAIPVVTDASIANVLPLAGGVTSEIRIADRTTEGAVAPGILTVVIGPRYFQTFRLPLVAGREFNEHDGAAGTPHAIVNDRTARLYFGDRSPIGERIALRAPGVAESSTEWLTIVGIAPDIRHQPRPRVLGAWDTDPVVYLPYRSAPPATVALLVRGAGDPGALSTTIRERLRELDPNVALYRVRTMAGVIDDAGWNSRVSQMLFNILAFIAVTTATVGLYAVTMHSVYQRTPELGLRTALGAGRWNIVRLILGRALAQISFGFLAGVVCTLLWGRAFSSGNSDVTISSVGVLATVAATLVALGMAAILIPLRRALRLDPAAAIRHE